MQGFNFYTEDLKLTCKYYKVNIIHKYIFEHIKLYIWENKITFNCVLNI